MEFPQGWHKDDAEVERILSTLPHPTISRDMGIWGAFDGKTSAYMWKAEEVILGRRIGAWKQKRGTCVSYGNGRAAQDRLLTNIAVEKKPELWKGQEVATAPIYAGSRVEIGGGRIRGDGSVGAWATKWLTSRGVLLRGVYGAIELNDDPNDAMAVRWGAPGAGVPDELEKVAKEHPVTDMALVTDVERACDLLATYKPIAVCSGVGYTMQRDARGFCRRSGSWAHCMEFRGVLVLKDGTVAIVVQNSWGNYLGGDVAVELLSGETVYLNGGAFLITLDDAARMLREGDSFGLAGVNGWAAEKLDWTFA